MCLVDLKDAYLISLSGHCQTSQEIPQIRMGRHHLRIHPSTVWSMQGTKNFHQAPPTSNGSPKVSGPANSDLFRRHPGDGRGSGTTAATSPTDYLPPRRAGLHSQQSEGALTPEHVPGTTSGRDLDEIILARGENTTNNQ